MHKSTLFACLLGIAASVPAVAAEAETNGLEKAESKIVSGYVNVDLMSAYVWRNTVCNDELVLQPSFQLDFVYFEPVYLGFNFWQGYNLTDRQSEVYTHGLVENDYNIHLGGTVWENEDKDTSLGLEIGHEWYDNVFVRREARGGNPDVRELYVHAQFDNPIVAVYGQASWRYLDFGDYKSAMHYELGFNKEIEVHDAVSVGADWNVNFGDGHYLNMLYGGTYSGRDADGEKAYNDSSAGFGGTTVKLYATWQVTEWLSLTGQVAYTGLLNGAYREAIGEQGDDYYFHGDSYPRDFVWGGITANISF